MEMNISLLDFQLLFKLLFPLLRMGELHMLSLLFVSLDIYIFLSFKVSCLTHCFSVVTVSI